MDPADWTRSEQFFALLGSQPLPLATQETNDAGLRAMWEWANTMGAGMTDFDEVKWWGSPASFGVRAPRS
jgi:hypothetical protein